jgi:Holliday junction resolvase
MNSNQKGKRGEREFAKFLSDRGYPARRGVQYSGGEDSPDVVCDRLSYIHLEVKRTERFTLYPYLAQAINDSGPTKTPVVAHRKSREEWVCILRAEDLLIMAEKAKAYDTLNTDNILESDNASKVPQEG